MFAILLMAPLAVQAQDSAGSAPENGASALMKAIPDNALGFVLVNNISQADAAISRLGTAMQMPMPGVLTILKMQLGIQQGLDEDGSAGIALLPSDSAKKSRFGFAPIVFVPVSDYKSFVRQFQPDDASSEIASVTIAGKPMIVGHKGSFAVFAKPGAKAELAKAIAAAGGVDSMVESFEPWLARHQVSLVATPTGTKVALQAAIKGLKQIKKLMSVMPDKGQAHQVQAAFDMYEALLTKTAAEIDAFAVDVNVDANNNLAIDSRSAVVMGGSWADALSELKPGDENRFAGLRAKPFMFAGEFVVPKEWADSVASLFATYFDQLDGFSENLSPEQQAKYLEAYAATMKDIGSSTFVVGVPKPGETIYDGTIAVIKVDNAKAALDRNEKAIREMSAITAGQANAPMKFTEIKRSEIAGVDALTGNVDLSGMAAAQKDPGTTKLMGMMFGPKNTFTSRDLIVDDHTLLSVFGSEENAKKALEEFKNPTPSFASDPAVQTTMKLLPARAQWIGLISVNGYVDMLREIFAGLAPDESVQIPEFPAMPPIGFAAEGSSRGLETTMVIPSETLAKGATVIRQAALGHKHKSK